jgi:hypothetical protein
VTHGFEKELRDIHLQGYVTAIKAGVGSIMASSYNSWNGVMFRQQAAHNRDSAEPIPGVPDSITRRLTSGRTKRNIEQSINGR